MNLEKSMAFLKELNRNNSKEWMDANKAMYHEAKSEFLEFVVEIINEVSKFDPTIANTEPKKSIFRINRDIRFSKNKSPYKNNFGMTLAEGGRNSGNPVYYFHLQPHGETMVAGGMYQPETDALKKIRQEIDYSPHELKKVIENEAFRDEFGVLSGETLKTAPKGYPKDHPNIALLRYKSFVAYRKFSDVKVSSPSLKADISKAFQALYPLNQYLSVAIS